MARAHAEGQRLAIDYRAAGVETLDDERFDLVTCMEVIEHVADPAAFVRGLARVLAPGGLLILSTPNRTPLSRLAMITVGEGLGRIPRGTHDWDKFLTPGGADGAAEGAGLRVTDMTGLAFSPLRGLTLSDNVTLNYLVTAVRA